MNLGSMIRDARKTAGMTQLLAAERADVSPRALWTLEQGGGTVTTFVKVAQIVEFRLTGLPQAKSLGQRLRAARLRKGWTQARLAARAGISVPTARALENDGGSVASLSAALSVLAPAARARKSEKANWTAGGRDKRYTPPWMLDEIVSAFGPISLDPCAGAGAAVEAERYIFEDEDGLTSTWTGRLAFMNPPFSAAAKWLERAYLAWAGGECETVIGLVPVRTNSRAFLTLCAGVADVLFLPGRPNFIDPTKPAHVSGQTPFGVMLIIWGGSPRAVRDLSVRLGARLMKRDTAAARFASSSLTENDRASTRSVAQ